MATPPAGSKSDKRSGSPPRAVIIGFDGRSRKHGTAREPHVRSRINDFARIVLQIFGAGLMRTLPAPRELILEQLERMLASETFAGAERSRVLLRFLVEHVVENQPDRLKEYTIGSEALGRGDSFDPQTDPIVRAEASRLRARLERYYGSEGRADTVIFALPKGSYSSPGRGPTCPARRVTGSR